MPRKKKDDFSSRLYLPIRSKKVRRISDGRIFSCAEGAALSYGTMGFANKIVYCCYGYLGDVFNERWEFVEDEETTPQKSEVKPEVSVPSYVELNSKVFRKAYRKTVLRVAPHLKQFIQTRPDLQGKFFFSQEIYDPFSEYFEQSAGEPLGFGVKQFSRHLNAWKDLYSPTIGLRVSNTVVKEKKKRLLLVGFFLEDIDGMTSIYDERYDMYLHKNPKSRIGKPRNRKPGVLGKAVTYVNAGITYSSLRAASKATMICREYIRYCCEGDVPFIKVRNRIFEFRYGNSEDAVEIKDQESAWLVNSTRAKPIVNLNTGEVYKSIREASRATGVVHMNIRRCCEEYVGIPPKKYSREGFIDWNYAVMGVESPSGELIRFQYYIDDEI